MKNFIFTIILIFTAMVMANEVHAATLSLSPSSGSYSVGTTFSVNILLDTEDQSIDGVDAHFNYDPAYLEVIQVTAGSLMPVNMANKVNKDNGHIYFSQITEGGTKFTSNNTEALATVTFKALKTGKTAIHFDFTPGSSGDSNVAANGGKDILTSVVNAEYILKDGFSSFYYILMAVLLIIVAISVFLNVKRKGKM